MKFIDEIEKELNYPFKGIISDIQENIAYSLVSKKPKISHQFCKTHILRAIDRILKTLAYHNQLSKLLKRLRSLKSVFIHQASYRLKKQKQVQEWKISFRIGRCFYKGIRLGKIALKNTNS